MTKDRLAVLTVLIFSRLPGASVAQPVERLICNQLVGGSNPSAGSVWVSDSGYRALPESCISLSVFYCGGVPERSKGTDCKSVGEAFGGSNPPPTTNLDLSPM